MPEIIKDILVAAITGGLFSFLMFLINRSDAKKEGMRCLLRQNILDCYKRNKSSKTIDIYEWENLEKMYKAYKGLKGNSFVDTIYKKMSAWEITQESDE